MIYGYSIYGSFPHFVHFRALYQYAKPAKVATQSVKDAVAAVFDAGDTVTTEPILFFYAPRRTVSKWHESQRFVIEIGGHRFFAEKGANQ